MAGKSGTAQIMDIKKFAVHDGDGIRTTVFFKGCPLRCKWCHNPEGMLPQTQLAYFEAKCVHCGSCLLGGKEGSCPANTMKQNRHLFYRDACRLCGNCERVCPAGAFRIYGRGYTVEELMCIIREDRDFYDCSGGGVTLSGGECLIWADFCAELLKACKKEGIHTAVDTCGYVPLESIQKVEPYTDVFLYDVKAMDEDTHIRGTGQSNRLILENLRYLSYRGAKLEIRIPYVPGYNSDQMEKIGAFLRSLSGIVRVRILPYHNLSETKYISLGMESRMPRCDSPGAEEIREAEALVRL